MVSVAQTSAMPEMQEVASGVPPASKAAPTDRLRRVHIFPRVSAHLDWIRGLSAAAVMLSHVRGLFFIDYPQLHHSSRVFALLYALTGLGHQAVMVFFVLSGFFIGSSVVAALREGRWSWKGYLINRVSRLELVLLPALLLGALCDQIGLHLASGFALYHAGLYKFYEPSVALRSNVGGFFGNLFFLQSVRFPVFGSNGPLWSLSYEFWYYIFFPAAVLAISWRGSALRRFLNLALALAVALFVGPQIRLYFLIWLAGAGVVLGPRISVLRKRWIFWPAAVFTFGLFVASLALSRVPQGLLGLTQDFSIGGAFALWLYVLAHVSREDASRWYSAGARTLAGFSYTLYLVHFPMLLLLRAMWNPTGNWRPDATHLLYGVGLTGLMLSSAYLVASVTEAQTDAVRRRLMRLLSAISNAPQSATVRS